MQCIYHIYRKCLAKRHIKLKKTPNPSKTYAWRALSRFMKQIGNCSNEVVVQLLDEIIDFVIVNNKGRGILAALHNKELIIHCCNRLKEKERHCSMVIQKLERSVAFVAAQYQVGEHLELRHGSVPEEILSEAHLGDFDLIVLGASKASVELSGRLLGDVAQRIVDQAQCPVLVVRKPEELTRNTFL